MPSLASLPVVNQQIDVSVVLPVYNEKGHLLTEIDRIRKALDHSPYSYELVVIDDGSSDGSSEHLRDIAGIRLFQFGMNRGSGAARRYGSQMARGRVIVWTDVDLSYPNEMIPDLVAELDRGYDQVVGARVTEQGTFKLLRRPAKWFIRRLAGFLTKSHIPDLNSGLRAFRSEVGKQFLHLLPSGFSCVTTITMTFLANGYSVEYVPIPYFERAGRSKFHWWTDTRRYLMQVIRLSLSYEPMRIFGPVGGILALAGLAKLGFDIIDKGFRIATNTLVIVGAAIAVLLVGVIADMLVQLNRKDYRVIPARTYERSA